MALAAEPIRLKYGATLLDGTVLKFTAHVPTVEIALSGARSNAAAHLHDLARGSRRLRSVEVPTARLAALIAHHIARPR